MKKGTKLSIEPKNVFTKGLNIQQGKVANPNPNVDAHSGVLLYSLGMKEWDYYTVIFAVSRAMGCMSAFTWSRIMGLPIERPGSVDA